MTLLEWLIDRGACDEGLDWARNLTPQQAWDTAPPEYLVWVACEEGVLDDRTLRRFACFSVRQVWHLLTDERSRRAVEVAERHAEGQAADQELAAAWDAAYAAAYAASAAAYAAAYAARAAANAAAAWDAARAAARDAASAAAYDAYAARAAANAAAAWDAARAAATKAQAAWLRANAAPNWSLLEDAPCVTS